MLKTINGGKQPTKGSKYSAGIDLYANEDVVIGAGETKMVGLGVKIDLNYKKYYIQNCLEKQYSIYDRADEEYFFNFFKKTHYLELHPRSSLRAKGLIAGVGIIDMDFKDEIKIILSNFSFSEKGVFDIIDNDFIIKKGDKIAQILLKEHKGYLFGIDSNEERKGGFGSTDK